MKNSISKLFSILMLMNLPFIQGCQKESKQQNCDGENTQNIETFYSEELSKADCKSNGIPDINKQINRVITNQIDFEKYISCTSGAPIIDFEKYFVLTGVYRHNQCAIFDSQQVYLCNNKMIYSIKMQEQDCLAITPVFYMAAIEKRYSNIPIEFDVQFFKNQEE